MNDNSIIEYYEKSRFLQHCGIRLAANPDGSITGIAEVMPFHLNGAAHIHGGMLFTLADCVGGANCRRYCNRVTTLNTDFHYLASPTTRYLYGNAKVIREGSSVIVLEVSITDDDKQLLATGMFTYYKFT